MITTSRKTKNFYDRIADVHNLALKLNGYKDSVAKFLRSLNLGVTPETMVLDVTDLSAMQKAIAAAAPFNILVNNAGTNRPKMMMDVTVEDFDVIMGLNVRAAYFVAQAVARRLIDAQQSGSIINISSQMGHVGASKRTVYCASKHAVEGMVKAMALELAGDGIRVLSVAPTFVRTEMTAAQLDDPAVGPRLLGQIPLGRFATGDDVADAVVWACSDRARMVTGTSIVVDGGWTAR